MAEDYKALKPGIEHNGIGVNDVCCSETEANVPKTKERSDAAFTPCYMLKARALFKRNMDVELELFPNVSK